MLALVIVSLTSGTGELNLWLTQDLTLYGRTLLAKTIGISQLIYTASMLSVPETVIKNFDLKKLLIFFYVAVKNVKLQRVIT